VDEKDITLRRFLREDEFKRMQHDFKGICRLVATSSGELEIAFKDRRFTIYYQGNPLATIVFRPNGEHYFDTHKKFFQRTTMDREFTYQSGASADYVRMTGDAATMRRALTSKYVEQLQKAIEAVDYGGEITFEQLLIADNPATPNFFIVDRQVADRHVRHRLDVLGLRRVEPGVWRFVVLDVKLGCNKELSGKVGEKLQTYVDHMKKEIAQYSACYTLAYQQKLTLGLLGEGMPESISIDETEVDGLVVVGSYSRMARVQVAQLKRQYPDIKVRIIDSQLVDENGAFEGVVPS